ncbi:MAG: phenylacetate--CoA ligase family protein, partial [Bacteroidetes bacterium]|nr:phenylacetate--CoA ligase family protein [Bacteroidota bacterium]
HTSGTTGKGLHITLSHECQQAEYAFRNLHLSWAGIYPGMKIAYLAGHPVANPLRTKPPFWAKDRINNSIYFSSQHISPQNMTSYLSCLNKFNPDAVIGYPSSIYLIALGLLESPIEVVRPKAVFISSETLLEYQKDTIENAFSCKVYNYYGNAERVGCIMECEYGNLHVQSEYSYIEFIKPDGSTASPGEIGEMVCTGFSNKAMPLIRYCIGDLAIPSNRICTCGRGGQIIDKLIGRIEDIIITPEGKHVGRLDHLFKDMLNVKEAQIVQDSIDLLTINIVKRNDFDSSDLKLLKQEARLRLGDKINLKFEFVDHLKKSPSGKLKFVISNVSSPFKKLKQPNFYELGEARIC